MKHTRCMFHFCFQCFILQALTIKNGTWCKRYKSIVQEIQNEGMKYNLKYGTLNFIRQTI